MTRTPTILGPNYDAPAQLAAPLYVNGPKRPLALAALKRAEETCDEDTARLMRWELGLLDLTLTTAEGASPYRGGSYEQYAEFYGFTPDTAAYARERANETQDVILKLHYLEFVLLRSEPRGRQWVELQREVLRTYREYVNGCRAGAGNDRHRHAGVYIEHALDRVAQLLARRGVVPPHDHAGWADWLVGLAEDSWSFPVDDPEWIDQQRHRWVADYLRHLTALPPDAARAALRTRSLSLLADAAAYYQATPLNDDFERRVAEVEAQLRKHWGEERTHEQMVRRQFEATVRRAEFHRSTGNGLLTALFFRQARALVEEHRQYFSAADVAHLQRAEQGALDQAVEGGEFSVISYEMEIPREFMDYTRDTPEATVEALVEQAAGSVPNRAQLTGEVRRANAAAPVQAIIPRTVIGAGKVVGGSADEEGNVALDVEQRAMLTTRLLGAAVAHTVMRASGQVGLTPDHLVSPLGPLDLDEGSVRLIRHGCERLAAGDFVSATHILVPHVEDALRQHLKAVGVDTTDFRADGDGTSRTDDATLGSLMHKALPDGRAVRDYLGADLWDHLDSVLNSQTGLNLRNEFAHGLARPQQCTPEVAGIALSLLYLLAAFARSQRT